MKKIVVAIPHSHSWWRLSMILPLNHTIYNGTPGIYAFHNIKNKKRYIGSAVDLGGRRRTHIKRLNKGEHCNKYLQAAWNKYGESSFRWIVIEVLTKEELLEREQWWIDNSNSSYNLFKVAGSGLGSVAREEKKAKIAASIKRRWADPEYKAATIAKIKSAVSDPDSRAKLSVTRKAQWKDPTYRQKVHDSQVGRKASDIARLNMSAAQKKRMEDPEQKARAIEAGKLGIRIRWGLNVAIIPDDDYIPYQVL